MTSKEIITLQFGQYANFVGTHWWNIQESSFQYGSGKDGIGNEEVDHDVLFREGETSRGEITFTPRLVLTELKGGLGGLTSTGALYDDDDDINNGIPSTDDLAWHGDVEVHKQPSKLKNQFLMDLDNVPVGNGDKQTDIKSYDLEQSVNVWSDYLRTFLHPKSLVVINEYNSMSENDPFDLCSKGANLKNIVEELEERIRFFAEECDLMQGFHILADAHNGFAGLSSSVCQYIHDEYSSKYSVTFPMSPAMFSKDSKMKSLKRNLNRAICLPIFLEHSSMVCPLSLWEGSFLNDTVREIPHLIYDARLSYHTSAILASALDTMTLNHRLKGNKGINLDNFCDNITSSSKKLASASISMPFPLLDDNHDPLHSRGYKTMSEYFTDHLDCDPWTDITPDLGYTGSSKAVVETYSQSLTLRGLISGKYTPCVRMKSNLFDQCSKPVDFLDSYLNYRFYGCKNYACSLSNPMKTSVPFPQFFDDHVKPNGFLRSTESENQYESMDFFNYGHAQSNGHVNSKNHHASASGDCLNSKSFVVSVPIMTNLQCSSNAANMLKASAVCLRQSKKRHFSFHSMENDDVETEIENLCVLQDEYKSEHFVNDSDSDGD